jgi:hypothetical protein
LKAIGKTYSWECFPGSSSLSVNYTDLIIFLSKDI